MRKWIYLFPLALCLIAGIAVGHFWVHPKSDEARKVLYYEDPMHPSYRSSKPGKAPDCGMDLVPVYAGGAAGSIQTGAAQLPGVAIEPAAQQLYGIKLVKAKMEAERQTIRLFARVEADDTRVFRIDFGTDGYVKETHDDAVGTRVSKDQHLATVYSPDFLAVAGGYLAANEHAPGVANAARDMNNSGGAQNAASVQARADRLRNLGMSDTQITEISQSHKLPEDVYVASPIDGFILTRSISPGMRIERRTELYTIADLSHVWITAEVFGHDVLAIRPGTTAVVTLPNTNEHVMARISEVLPEVDPVTHATKIRLVADNPGFKLRPQMFANVEIPVSFPPGLSVPVDAVLDSGLSKRVFVQTADNRFESRPVETGWQMGDRIQIVKGLDDGDSVVAAGTFLVDSESRLRQADGAGASMAGVSHVSVAMEKHSN